MIQSIFSFFFSAYLILEGVLVMKFINLFLLSLALACSGCPTPVVDDELGSIEEEVEEEAEEEVVNNDDSSGDDDDSAETEEDSATEEPEEEPDPITWTDCSGIPGDKACDFTFLDQQKFDQ